VTAARVDFESSRFTVTDIAVASFYAREALAIDGGLSDAHAALGRLAFYRDDHPTARAEFERALAGEPRNSAAHEWFALEYLISGDPPQALPQFEAAAEVDPGSEPVAQWLALGYYCAGRFDDARVELEHAIELEPGKTMPASCSRSRKSIWGSDVARCKRFDRRCAGRRRSR